MQYSTCKSVCMHLFHCPSVWWRPKKSPWLQPCWLSGPSHGPRSVPGVRPTGRCFHVLSIGKLANPNDWFPPWCSGHRSWLCRTESSVLLQMFEPLYYFWEVLCRCHFDSTSDYFRRSIYLFEYIFLYRMEFWLEQSVNAPYMSILHHWIYLVGMSIKQFLCANTQEP